LFFSESSRRKSTFLKVQADFKAMDATNDWVFCVRNADAASRQVDPKFRTMVVCDQFGLAAYLSQCFNVLKSIGAPMVVMEIDSL
jgi:hypothetical protein